MKKFRLYNHLKKNAVFTDNYCDKGHKGPFLDGDYFDSEYDGQGVCLNCLETGEKTVSIQKYMVLKIGKYTKSPQDVEQIIRELERTPPVPWIQYNDWSFCCNGPMQYQGEHSTDVQFKSNDLKEFPEMLWEIADENGKKQAGNPDALLASINNGFTACFIFKCQKCSRFEAVCQTY